MSNLAMLLNDQGKLAEAEPLYREALEGQREVLGSTHEKTLLSARNLAKVLDESADLLCWPRRPPCAADDSGRAEEAARLRSEYGV